MLQARNVALAFAAVLGGLLAAGESADAQQMRRPRAPRRYRSAASEPLSSPYLNLIRPGADPGLNYYTLVQPQLQQEQFNLQQNVNTQRLGRQLDQQQAEIMTPYGAVRRMRPTGRSAATYMNYSHYYPGLGVGASGGGRSYTSTSSGGGGMGMGGMGGMGMGGFGGGF